MVVDGLLLCVSSCVVGGRGWWIVCVFCARLLEGLLFFKLWLLFPVFSCYSECWFLGGGGRWLQCLFYSSVAVWFEGVQM